MSKIILPTNITRFRMLSTVVLNVIIGFCLKKKTGKIIIKMSRPALKQTLETGAQYGLKWSTDKNIKE